MVSDTSAKPGTAVRRDRKVSTPPAYQRFAPGDAHLGDAEAGADAHDAQDLLVAQDLAVVELGEGSGRGAVETAQVAPVGDRDPQVGQGPPVAVDQDVAHQGAPWAAGSGRTTSSGAVFCQRKRILAAP